MADELIQRIDVNVSGVSKMSSDLMASAESARRIQEYLKQIKTGPFGYTGATRAGPFGASFSAPPQRITPITEQPSAKMSLGDAMRQAWDRNKMGGGGTLGDAMKSMWTSWATGIDKLAKQKAAEAMEYAQKSGKIWWSLQLQRREEETKEREEKEKRDKTFTNRVGIGAAAGFGFIGYAASKANPFAMERFEQAKNDFLAVMGRTLIPAIEGMTSKIRYVADTFNELGGTEKSIFAGAVEGATFGGGAYYGLKAGGRLAGKNLVGRGLARVAGPVGLAIGAQQILHEFAPETMNAIGYDIGAMGRTWNNFFARARGQLGIGGISAEEYTKRSRIIQLKHNLYWEEDAAKREQMANELNSLQSGGAGPGTGALGNVNTKDIGAIVRALTGGSSSFGASGRKTSFMTPQDFLEEFQAQAFQWSAASAAQNPNSFNGLGGAPGQNWDEMQANIREITRIASRYFDSPLIEAGDRGTQGAGSGEMGK